MIETLQSKLIQTQEEKAKEIRLREELNMEQSKRANELHQSQLLKKQQELRTVEQMLMDKD